MKEFTRSVRSSRGVSLVELMVAMVLGLFLMFGAVTVYNQSRATYRTTEAVARLQEVGRLAMSTIENEVRMANYWGLSNRADYIVNAAPPGTTPAGFSATQIARINACGPTSTSNWALNLAQYVQGSNDSYGLSCAAYTGAVTGTDTLTVRRASSTTPTSLDVTKLYLQTSRIQGTVFIPACTDPEDVACIPAAYSPPASQSRLLIVRSFYVDRGSTLRNDYPSLRRKSFSQVTTGTGVADDEIVAGVEDMQIRFGVDTDNDTNANEYRNPNAVTASDFVVSVQVWLRIRSEDPELTQVDGTTYNYAGVSFTPADRYRRVLLSKTIALRNNRS